MWEFLVAGGPVMFILLGASIVAVGFIIERGLALRWRKIIPPEVASAVESGSRRESIVQVANNHPSPVSTLLLLGSQHLHWPKQENTDSIETKARHEVTKMERGLVILEIIVGIAPLTGLVGTLHGLIALFGTLGQAGMKDNAAVAKGISISLNTTLMGLVVAIPALIAWSYYNKKVEVLAVEMERVCDEFLRNQYRSEKGKA